MDPFLIRLEPLPAGGVRAFLTYPAPSPMPAGAFDSTTQRATLEAMDHGTALVAALEWLNLAARRRAEASAGRGGR